MMSSTTWQPISLNQKKAWTHKRPVSTWTKAIQPRKVPGNSGAGGGPPMKRRTHESLSRRLAREVPDVTDRWDGDGIGDVADSDGEPIDDRVGDIRAGRLVAFGVDPTDPTTDYRAHDWGDRRRRCLS
jgi:hypothetical protein